MEEQDKGLTRRKVVRIITVLASIPFGFGVFITAAFSTDSLSPGFWTTMLPLVIVIIPVLLLVVSLVSKKLYWLWLSIMIIILLYVFGDIGRVINIQATNVNLQNDFDCIDTVSKGPSYLSMKNNGDIFEVTKSGNMISESNVGNIGVNGDVNFTRVNEQHKDNYLNCKNKEGEFLKDVYKNIVFNGK